MNLRHIVCAAVFLGLLSCAGGGNAGLEEGEWTVFRGETSLSGSTALPLPRNPRLRWSATTGVRTVASPVVRDGVDYTVSRRGLLRGVALSDGSEVFSKDLGAFVEATPMIADGVIYVGTIDGSLLALHLPDGALLWEFASEGQISSAPMPAGYAGEDAVLFGSYDNYLYTLRRSDGSLLSKFETGYYLNGAVAVADRYAAYGGCDQWLRVIDLEAGVQTDSLLLDSYVPGSPVFRDGAAYVGDYGGDVYGIALEDGKIAAASKVYAASSEQDASSVGLPAVGAKQVYFFTGGRSLACVSRKDGKRLWTTMLKGPVGESSPMECRNGVLVCTKSGIISILDAGSGEVRWEYDAGEDILGCPAILPGGFLVVTAKGTLLCFEES